MKAAACQFTAAEQTAHDCKGCLFEHEHSTECQAAEAIARRLDLPMCEDRAPNGNAYIYVLTKSDPRQLRLTSKEDMDTEPRSAPPHPPVDKPTNPDPDPVPGASA